MPKCRLWKTGTSVQADTAPHGSATALNLELIQPVPVMASTEAR
jgi:hypothetical protein